MVEAATLPPLVRGEWYPMSWEKFLAWAPDEGQAEWVDGEGIAYVSNSPRHIQMVFFLAQLLNLYTRVFDLGDVFFDRLLIRLPARPAGRMPDIVVLGRADVPRNADRFFEGRAIFVSEFLSEDSVERDLREKRTDYESAGIPEYPIIDARLGEREFVYLRLDATGHYQPVEPDEQGRYHSEVLPGFWLDPNWFWQDPLPNPLTVLRRISPEAWRRLAEEVEADS
jgi:Uma2 family endonuclease